jgi:hypothetical protein
MHRNTIGTVGGHGFDHIHHNQNPRLDEYFAPFESPGITGTIDPFMILVDHIRHDQGNFTSLRISKRDLPDVMDHAGPLGLEYF